MVFDDRTLKKWFALEGHRLNEGLVRSPRPIAELLEQEEPSLATKKGGEHVFDRDTLERFAKGLSPLVRSSIKLPITIYVSHQTQDDGYIQDKHAIRALEQLDLVDTEPRDGKLWMGRPLAYELAKAWPTIFQFCRV